jgi:hypothetical protein
MLTIEEKKKIIKKILKESYQGIPLTEAKNSRNIKNNIKLNLEFYSNLKKRLPKSSLDEAFHTGNQYIDILLNIIGNVKDFLTSTDLGKWFADLINKLANKVFPSFSKNPNDWTDKLSNGVKSFAKWLGPKSIAYLMAVWKNKTIKPKQEMIDAQMPKANIVYKIILTILILVAFYKLWLFIAPFYSAALAPNAIISLKGAIVTAGLKGFSLQGFNVLGLVNKIQHATHDETKHELENAYNSAKESLSNELSSQTQQNAAQPQSSVEFVKPNFRPTFS